MTSLKLINSNGLENFSMRKLASELDCQPASIYHHYANKNEILNSLYVTLHETFFSDLFSIADLHTSLVLTCKKVQTEREAFLFLKQYRKASFLTDESKEKIGKCQFKYHSEFETALASKKKNKIDYLIAMGPISEIVAQNLELSDDEIELLVTKIMLALKGGK